MDRSSRGAAPPRPTGALRALQLLAALSVLVLLYQGLTAGALTGGGGVLAATHGLGAVVLHVVTGLTAVAAVLHARASGGPWWPAAVAGLVFVVSFGQAALGSSGVLTVHVPLAMLLLVGSAWVAAWASLPSARRPG